MKRLIMALGLIFSVLLIQAQPPQSKKPPSVEERIKRTSEVINKDVQPNAEQKKAIETAYITFFTAADKLMENNPPNIKDQKTQQQLEKLEKERDERIKKVLTISQYKKYELAAKKLQPPKPDQKGNGGPPPPRNN